MTTLEGPGVLSSVWLCDRLASGAVHRLSLNGAVATNISGTSGWVRAMVDVPGGRQQAMWELFAGAAALSSSNFLDQVVYWKSGTPPAFALQPTGGAFRSGSQVTLSALVLGAEPTSVQWIRNGRPIPGATGSSFVIAAMDEASVGAFELEAANAAGRSRSECVRLDFAPDLSPALATQSPGYPRGPALTKSLSPYPQPRRRR